MVVAAPASSRLLPDIDFPLGRELVPALFLEKVEDFNFAFASPKLERPPDRVYQRIRSTSKRVTHLKSIVIHFGWLFQQFFIPQRRDSYLRFDSTPFVLRRAPLPRQHGDVPERRGALPS